MLHAAEDAGAPYQVVHFDGHGVWADTGDDGGCQGCSRGGWLGAGWSRRGARAPHGYLLFEDPRRPGSVQLADGPALGTLLADAGVPLLVLNACRSAHADLPAKPAGRG